MSGQGLLSKVLRGATVAFALKLLGAVLSYLMFVMLARGMSFSEFGRFSFAFSMALFLGKLAGAGQQQLALRLLPPPGSDESESLRSGVIRFALRTVTMASLFVATSTAALSLARPDWRDLCLQGTALLVPALAFADLQAAIQHANGRIMLAIAPREVIWRIALATAGFLAWKSVIPKLHALEVMAWAAALLYAILILQAAGGRSAGCLRRRHDERRMDTRPWALMSVHFLVTTVVVAGAPSIAVVILGWALSPEQTGPFFAALKTAQVVDLFLIASNVIGAPLIAQHFARQEMDRVQLYCRLIAAAGGGMALAVFLVTVVAGRDLLALFGSGFEAAYPELIILGTGSLLSAMNGPNGILLQMAGEEEAFARIVLISSGVALTVLPVAAIALGGPGAAVVMAAATNSWNALARSRALRHLGIDPSVLSLLHVKAGRSAWQSIRPPGRRRI